MEPMQNQVTKTALLVEDEPIVKRVISSQLTNLGYKVETAGNAKTAIKLLKEKAYCLILTDLRLPDKNGIEVIKAARQSECNQGTPLIVSSAQLSQSDFKIYYELGADAILIKPYSSEILEQTIQKCHLQSHYERKFLFQTKKCLKSFEKKMNQLEDKEDTELWLEHFQTLLTESLNAIMEYRQWITFKKSKVKG